MNKSVLSAAMLIVGLSATFHSNHTFATQTTPVVKGPTMCHNFPYCEGTTNEEKPPKENASQLAIILTS